MLIAFTFILSIFLVSSIAFAFTTRGNAPIPTVVGTDNATVQTYWNQRHTIEQIEALVNDLDARYDHVKKFPIGHTWEERTL